jgi:ribosomal protein S18 acetylase RimI-like enzyme
MQHRQIKPAERADLPALDRALRDLSRTLGDTHRAEIDTLERALFGPAPSVWAQVAPGLDSADGLRGAVLFSPVFSTVRGAAGLYVSDLWVHEAGRGKGLGAALLSSAAARAAVLWGAEFLRLAVYDQNPRARALYDALGFEPATGETVMRLSGPAFQRLRSQQ